MTKELGAKIEDISKLLYEVYDVPSGICEHIEQALTELEQIKNAEPTKALERLEDMAKDTYVGDYYKKNIDTIKQALIKAEQDRAELKRILDRFEDKAHKNMCLDTSGLIRFCERLKEKFKL